MTNLNKCMSFVLTDIPRQHLGNASKIPECMQISIVQSYPLFNISQLLCVMNIYIESVSSMECLLNFFRIQLFGKLLKHQSKYLKVSQYCRFFIASLHHPFESYSMLWITYAFHFFISHSSKEVFVKNITKTTNSFRACAKRIIR